MGPVWGQDPGLQGQAGCGRLGGGPHALRLAGDHVLPRAEPAVSSPSWRREAGKGSGLGRGSDPGRTHVCTREHVHGACASAGPSEGREAPAQQQ